MSKLLARLAPFRKLVTAVVGGIAEIVSLGLLHGTAQTVAVVLIAAATSAGVYQVTNAPAA